MKNTILFLINMTILVGIVSGQNTQLKEPCLFDYRLNDQQKQNTEKVLQAYLTTNPSTQKSSDSIRTIPVVIHVIHNGGSENISKEQIDGQMRILNEDYGKLTGSNGDGAGVDTKVRFTLAKIDPNGKCTNGVVRIQSPLTSHQSYQRSMLKELSFWDNKKYLNIYVVNSINGNVGGYSSFPGGPDDEDGIVVRDDQFGDIGTASSELGRTMTHEIGHWLGLYHVFNNSCGSDICTDGDYVCDTPPAFEPHFSCVVTNSCNNDSPDLNDNIENYMDYTPDACKNMLSAGQKERIDATLNTFRTLIWSQTNLVATGCDSLYQTPENCPVVADLVALNTDICIGNSIQFMDKSLNNVVSWNWFFPGGNPTNSIIQNPMVAYDTIGVYDVKLIVTDSSGYIDSLTINNYVSVNEPGVGRALPYGENFDSGVYPPNDITINNLDGGITWQLDSNASVSGNYSIRINNLINTNYGSADEIILPYFDFTTLDPNIPAYMTFNWAYAKSDPSFSDEMIVLVSTDCGVTFKQAQYRANSGLTTAPTQSTPFVPTASQWNNNKVYLNLYKTFSYVLIKIVNVTDGGNNLYIDDLYVGDGTPLDTDIKDNIPSSNTLTVYPNPAQDFVNISLNTEGLIPTRLQICNVVGQTMFEQLQFRNAPNEQPIKVNIESWESGMYFIRIKSQDSESINKIIKQ